MALRAALGVPIVGSFVASMTKIISHCVVLLVVHNVRFFCLAYKSSSSESRSQLKDESCSLAKTVSCLALKTTTSSPSLLRLVKIALKLLRVASEFFEQFEQYTSRRTRKGVIPCKSIQSGKVL